MKHKHRILYSITLLGFLLGVRGGYIALWKDGEPEPVKIFPYKAQMLPSEDQKRLEKGIKIQDFADLTRIIEDYMS